MTSDSFRHKVADLTRKSRKAVKLYSNVAKKPSKCSEEWVKDALGDIQIDEWKKINADLHRELCRILEFGSQRTLVASVFELRDVFYNNFRKRETDSRTLQRDLISCVESSQYSKVVALGYKLSALNAEIQALQAAYQELQNILKGYSSGSNDSSISYGASNYQSANRQQYGINSSGSNSGASHSGRSNSEGSVEDKKNESTSGFNRIAKVIPIKKRFG